MTTSLVLLSKYTATAFSKYRIYSASSQPARGKPTMRPWRSRRPYSIATACSTALYKHQAAALSLVMFKQSPPHRVLGYGKVCTQRKPLQDTVGALLGRHSGETGV